MLRRSMIITFIALVSITCLLAPSVAGEMADDQTTLPATITGRTVDPFDEPISGVLVIIDTGENTTTDSQGHFTLFTTRQDHTISFYKENYTTETFFISISHDQGTLNIGEITLQGDPNPNMTMIFIIFIGCTAFIVIVLALAFMSKD
ncbi:MAG: hypothetical protein GKC03_08355 [Methanomassiliicoccales archaeon]|nr:hypothetical protein [Methanomassiliicoccales archaeon]